MKTIFMISAFVFSLFLYAPLMHAQTGEDQGYSHGYSSNYDDFTTGYRQGYDRGLDDRNAHMDFDFMHNDAYQNGTMDFRSGFERGYRDAYSGRAPQSEQTTQQ